MAVAITAAAGSSCTEEETTRSHELLTKDWLFALTDSADSLQDAYEPNFPDEGWRRLDLPHDWAIEGTFSESNPSGVGGGALPGGERADGQRG